MDVAVRPGNRMPRRLGSRRYSRFGNLRYGRIGPPSEFGLGWGRRSSSMSPSGIYFQFVNIREIRVKALPTLAVALVGQ